MNNIAKANINTSLQDKDLLDHMPKAFQTMAMIEQRARTRFMEIMASIERRETTLAEVKRKRGIDLNDSQEVEK